MTEIKHAASWAKWPLLAIPLLALLAYATAGSQSQGVWSGDATVQIGRMVAPSALLFRAERNPEMTSSLELIQSPIELAAWISTRDFRRSVFTSTVGDLAKNDSSFRVFNSNLRAFPSGHRLVRIEVTATSADQVEHLLKAITAKVIERHNQIADARQAITARLIADHQGRIQSAETRPAPPQALSLTGPIDARAQPADIAASLYVDLQRLKVADQLREPTRLYESPVTSEASRHPSRFYLGLVVGLMTLMGALLASFILARRPQNA